MNVFKNHKTIWIMALATAGMWSQGGLTPLVEHSPNIQRGLANVEEISDIERDITEGKIAAAEYNQKLAEEVIVAQKESFDIEAHLKKISALSAQSEALKLSLEKTKFEKEHLLSLLIKESFDENEVEEINKSIASIEKQYNQSSENLTQLEEQIQQEMKKVSELFSSRLKEESQARLDELNLQLEQHQKSSLELGDELGKMASHAEEKDKDIEKLKVKNAELIKAEKEIQKTLCAQQEKASNLESEISTLLEDKEAVTKRILNLADKKEDLLSDIDELKEFVTPKKKKEEKVTAEAQQVAANDLTALLSVLTQLSQQLQLSQQFQFQFQYQGSQMFGGGMNPLNSWSNMHQYMNPQQKLTPAWMHGIGGESLSGNPGYNPMATNREFINQNTFQMERPYGSDLLGGAVNRPTLDFGTVRRSFQPDHNVQARDVSSVFFDFTQQ